MSPVLCTQPRRFAVVAVAKMVAQSRNSLLGEEIGYHIGHSKNLSQGYTTLSLSLSLHYFDRFSF